MMFRTLLHLFVFVLLSKLSLNADACSITLSSSTSQKEISNVRRVYIKKDVDLFGQTLYLSKRSKLICKGGSVKNGSIVFNETEITGNPHLFCNVKGTIINEVLYPDWFLQDNNLDHLYENGFFTLAGMSKIEFQNKSYVTSVRSFSVRNNNRRQRGHNKSKTRWVNHTVITCFLQLF